LGLLPELHANSVEINFLDDLQTETGTAFLALTPELSKYNISDDKLKTQLLSGKVKPHLDDSVAMDLA
jgi:hypothetical protein